MSTLFQYQVDGETMRSCLGVIGRAAERVARGQSAFLGEVEQHCAGVRKKYRRKRSNKWLRHTEAVKAEVRRLRSEGLFRKEIAERMGLEITQVDFILYAARPHVRTGGGA